MYLIGNAFNKYEFSRTGRESNSTPPVGYERVPEILIPVEL